MSRTTARIILAVIGVIWILAMAFVGGLVEFLSIFIATCAFIAILVGFLYIVSKAFPD